MEVETFIDIDGKVLKKQIIQDHEDILDGVMRVEYRYKGKLHRKGGPAIIEHYEGFFSGWPKNIETWCSHGRTHRLNGPAIIEDWGGIVYYFFYKRNEQCSVRDVLKGEQLSWWVISHKKTKDPVINGYSADEVWTD